LPEVSPTYGENGVAVERLRSDRFSVFVGLVIGAGLLAIAVSMGVGLLLGAGFYDDTDPCHECEGCNP